ncbi:MAG: hemin ABC transporter substrate-binding protein [Salibacteraceae bacterium]
MMILGASCSQDSLHKEGSTSSKKSSEAEAQKIVSLNGAISETIAAAGYAHQLVGVDVTSTYPESVAKVPKVGYNRNIQAEGVLALSPTLILGNEGNLKPEVRQQFKSVSVKTVLFPKREWTLEGTEKLLRDICDQIDATDKVDPMMIEIKEKLSQVQPFETAPRVLFIYARGAGTLLAAGSGTQMQAIIEMAGGQNAVSGFEQFKPLTSESLVEANPEVILMFSGGLESLEGTSGLLEVPGVIETSAGQNEAIVTMDGPLLSNFGPRLGEAALLLNKRLHEVLPNS